MTSPNTTKTYWERFDIPLYASPQDVGREATVEAFAKSLESHAAGYAARGDSIFNGSIIAEELTEQARRLRSLAANGGGRG